MHKLPIKCKFVVREDSVKEDGTMKANELREMQTAELTSKLADLKAELFNLRFSMPSTSWRTPAASKQSRRTSPA